MSGLTIPASAVKYLIAGFICIALAVALHMMTTPSATQIQRQKEIAAARAAFNAWNSGAPPKTSGYAQYGQFKQP